MSIGDCAPRLVPARDRPSCWRWGCVHQDGDTRGAAQNHQEIPVHCHRHKHSLEVRGIQARLSEILRGDVGPAGSSQAA